VTDPARLDVADGVATITLDSPENRNALSVAMLDALGDRLHEAIEDVATRVVVLTNTGPAFCAGADLKGDPTATVTARHDLAEILTTMLDSPKPVIGRIAGHCLGGGVGLAAACDVSMAADDARFGFSEVRIGVAPAIISVVCLPKMRRSDAAELFLTGERISAEHAAAVGLINRAVPRADLDAAVDELVRSVQAGAPGALSACKQLLAQVPTMDRAAAFAWTGELSARLFQSPEAEAGKAAFRDGTQPPWVST
jgi:methylglutaconyl-CoA hydratase